MVPLSLLGLISLVQWGAVQGAKPADWIVCKKDMPSRNECLKTAINNAIQSLVNGNKKLGVLPIDPFHIGRIHTKGDPNGPVGLDVHFKDFVLYNIRNLEVTDVELKGRHMKVKGKVPGTLEAKSPYTISGKILALPLTGDGPSNFTFHDGNMSIDITFKKETEERNGKNYLVVENLIERSIPKKIDIYLGNLFNGNKALGETMNKVLNDNWELVWKELKPLFEDAMSEVFLQLSNRVFSNIPVNEIDLI